MRLQIARFIAKDMHIYKIDGYWYARPVDGMTEYISKVTCKDVSGNGVEDIAHEIYRVAGRGYQHYELRYMPEYGCEMQDTNRPTGMSWDWKYRRAIKDALRDLKALRDFDAMTETELKQAITELRGE